MFLMSVYTFKHFLRFLHAYIYSSLNYYHSLENDRSWVEKSYPTVNSYHQNFFQIAIDKDLFLQLFNICKILFVNRNLF